MSLEIVIIVNALIDALTITILITLTILIGKLQKKIETLEDMLKEILLSQQQEKKVEVQTKQDQNKIIEILKFYGKNFL